MAGIHFLDQEVIKAPVATIGALKARTVTSVSAGVMCNVVDTGVFYYDPAFSANSDDFNVVKPNSGSGNWINSVPIINQQLRERKLPYFNFAPRILNLASYDVQLKGFLGGFTDGRYGYFVPHYNGSYHGKVARVDLQDFSTIAVLNLASYDINLTGFLGGFTDGRYGYFSPWRNSIDVYGKVARIDLVNFSTVAVLNLASYDADLKGFAGSFTDGRYGYFVPFLTGITTFSGKVARVNLLDFSTVTVLNLASYDVELKGFTGGFTDGKYGYFVPNAISFTTYIGKVARVNLQDFSTVVVLNLASYDVELKGFTGGFTDGKYGYFVPSMIGATTYIGKVARVDLQNFSTVTVLNLASYDAGLKGFAGGFTDGRYGYFTPFNNGSPSGKVARADLRDFSTVAVLNLASYDVELKGFQGCFADGKYSYFVPFQNSSYFGKVARLQIFSGGNF